MKIIILLSLCFSFLARTAVYAAETALFAPLEKALTSFNEGKVIEARQSLLTWKTTEPYQEEYKNYFGNIWSGDLDQIWKQYKKLKTQKKFIRLRLDLFSRVILASSEEIAQRKTFTDTDVKKESRVILKQLSGTSEGEIAETSYLKWIQKNKYYDAICKAERKRWVTQPDIEFTEIQIGLAKCPMKFEDFTTRMRRLIFAARETQAQQEIELYLKSDKGLKDWEKVYVQAIFNSNVGDPLAALNSLSKFEGKLISSDYAENYFYISQRAGELEKSEAILNKIIKQYKEKNKNISDMLFQKAFLFYQSKRYSEAYKIFDQLFAIKANHKKKKKTGDFEQVAWLRAWSLYLNNDIEKALSAFNEMRTYTSDSSRLSYWIAMCYQRQDQTLTAMQLFKKSSESLSNNETYTYYNLLSWLRYQDLKRQNNDVEKNALIKDLWATSKDRRSIFAIPSEDVSREQIQSLYSFILSETHGDEQNQVAVVNDENEIIFSVENAGIVVQSEEELKRHIEWAKFLIQNRQGELAKWHLYELEKNLKLSKNAKIMIQFYTENVFYYRALSLSQRQAPGRMSFDKDTFLLKSIYPEAYKEDILQFAKQRKIDPFIILSIMKAETQYKSDAISPVGAVGLMQFMPYTLEKLTALVEKEVKTTELFDPKKSIEMGAAYLKKLLIEMKDQNPLTAAAYNGGPHRVKAWVKRLGHVDYDVFIEHIPFAETRTYVKRVLTFKSTYDKIYQKKLSSEELSYLIKPQPLEIIETLSLKEEWTPFAEEMKKTNKN
ncbi:MAG: lytic transglycosylase domain-containing protein [Bdellovibrionaceae bacterium]|nr:lytic transglycosylase domain-containing protein [Pseudobdellovibrionaceae bacterium]